MWSSSSVLGIAVVLAIVLIVVLFGFLRALFALRAVDRGHGLREPLMFKKILIANRGDKRPQGGCGEARTPGTRSVCRRSSRGSH